MKFDKLVDLYLEEFDPSQKRLGFKTNVTGGPISTGPKPDGFNGDTGSPEPQNVSKLFPNNKKRKK